METEPLAVDVVVHRFAIVNRWQSHQWRPLEIITDPARLGATPGCLQSGSAGSSRCVAMDAGPAADDLRCNYSGFEVRLFTDEAEGYFLNISSPHPCWFIMSRLEIHDDIELMVPKQITLSYNEAARLMDGGERVDTLPLPDAIIVPMTAFVATHYRPEVKRKRKKPSFEGGAGVDLMARAEGTTDGR